MRPSLGCLVSSRASGGINGNELVTLRPKSYPIISSQDVAVFLQSLSRYGSIFPGIESAVPAIDSPFEFVAAVTGKKVCVNAEAGQQAVLSNELHVLSVSRQTQFGWFSQNHRRGNTVRQPPAHFENVL